jgi:hypothetical protein
LEHENLYESGEAGIIYTRSIAIISEVTMVAARYSFVFLSVALAGAGLHAQSPADKAAEVNGRPILTSEVDAQIEKELAKLEEQVFALRKKQLDTMIDQRLVEDEAKKERHQRCADASRGDCKSGPAGRITKFYEENKAKLG